MIRRWFILILMAMGSGGIHATELKGHWQIGVGPTWVSTTDDIRSNAAVVILAQPGPDGLPDSGDETVLAADPRPDADLARETSVDDGLQWNLHFSYNFAEWFSLRIGAGYYGTQVVQLDTFAIETTLGDFNGDAIILPNETQVVRQSRPIVAGDLTMIPLTLTGVFRLLPAHRVNPYVGVGAGYDFVDAAPSAELENLDAFLRWADDPNGGGGFVLEQVYPTPSYTLCQGTGCAPYEGLTFQADDATQWHLMAGVEYFPTPRLSIYFDASYSFLSQDVRIGVDDGHDQVTFSYVSPGDSLPYCTDPIFDWYPFPDGRGSIGIPGICRPDGSRYNDQLLVQGGTIHLDAFNFAVGVRWRL